MMVLNKLTEKYSSHHLSLIYHWYPIKLWNVKVNLSFIMYRIQYRMSILSYLCEKKTHCFCWTAYARWALLAAYSLSSQIQITVNVSFSFCLKKKLSFTVHLSDSSILNKQAVRWLNYLRYLPWEFGKQSWIFYNRQSELFSISIWFAPENAL